MHVRTDSQNNHGLDPSVINLPVDINADTLRAINYSDRLTGIRWFPGET